MLEMHTLLYIVYLLIGGGRSKRSCFEQYQIKISTFLSNCNIYVSHYVYIIVLSVNFSYLEIHDYLLYCMQTVWIT